MKNKSKPLSEVTGDEIYDAEELKAYIDYFVLNGVEILRENPMCVTGLERLTPKPVNRDPLTPNEKKRH